MRQAVIIGMAGGLLFTVLFSAACSSAERAPDAGIDAQDAGNGEQDPGQTVDLDPAEEFLLLIEHQRQLVLMDSDFVQLRLEDFVD